MDMNTATLPRKGLKTKPYSMDMNKDIATLPKKGLKKYDYSIVYKMNKRDLKKLTKGQLIKLLLKQEKKPKVVIVDDTKPVPTPRNKVNQLVQFLKTNQLHHLELENGKM